MLNTIKPIKATVSVQIEAPTPLHDKIVRYQGLNKLNGKKRTIPETCNELLEFATNQLLPSNS